MEKRADSSEVNYRHGSNNSKKYNDDRDSKAERSKHHSSTSSRDSKDSRSPTRSRRHRSRSPGRDRRPSPEHRRHRRSRSRSPNKKSFDRKTYEDKHDSHRNKRDRRSRSRSSERAERNRERNKIEMRQLMAKNYEEQIAKIKNNAALKQKPHNAPLDPSKLVEQIERRKLLWGKKEKPADAPASSSSVWNQTKFTDDSDGKVTAKFKRLMGMKDGDAAVAEKGDETSEVVIRKQEEYFADLEKQYEVARATTHTQRGLGLGFSTRSYVLPKPNASGGNSSK